MIQNLDRAALGRALAATFLASMLLVIPPMAAAQEGDRPCVVETAPEDEFESAGVGLTRPELMALYGAEEIGQGSIIYDYQGVDLHWVGCDLILAFPLDGSADQAVDELALAESLLPADAEAVGAFTPGTTIAPNVDQTATLWRSAALAERFALMDENRGGEILILYSYGRAGLERGPIERVELRTLELPE